MSPASKITGKFSDQRRLFVTGFDVARDWKFPERFDPSDYSGMYFCQRLRTGAANDVLLIWWETPDCYSPYWSVQLSNDLDIAAPRFAGTALEQRPKGRRWYSTPSKWVPWAITAIATTATLLGNFTQLENYGAWAFAKPETDIIVSPVPVKLVENEPSGFEFKMHNRSTGYVKVVDLRATPATKEVAEVSAQIGPLTPIEPGELRTVTCPIFPKKPGGVQIILTGEATAGRLRQSARLGPAQVEVTVWPAVEASPPLKLQHSFKDNAVYIVEAHHGKPPTKVISYQATAPGEFTFVDLKGALPSFQSAPTEPSAVIRWAKEAAPLIVQRFSLTVHANKSHSKEEWKAYETEIKVEAAPALEP